MMKLFQTFASTHRSDQFHARPKSLPRTWHRFGCHIVRLGDAQFHAFSDGWWTEGDENRFSQVCWQVMHRWRIAGKAEEDSGTAKETNAKAEMKQRALVLPARNLRRL